ncbi:hypothetical protein Zmor_017873 [Zophobas morio]|uniref:Gustatory receptor n=1 Tax=Zophobas morio TaxID=2755281 RepID=A0AA38ICD4_9CUCU|nr:hypothetical protein Zmor_017873 [Zophobas morio]
MKTNAVITTDLFQVLEPLLVVARVAGFLPVTSEKKGSQYSIEESLKFKIYSYVLATILTVLALLGLNEDLPIEHSIRMKNSLIKYIVVVDVGEIVVTVFTGVLTTPFKLKYFWKILNSFTKMEKVFSIHRTSDERQRSILYMGVSLTIVAFVLAYDAVLWIINASDMSVFFKRYTALYILYFLVFIQEFPFYFFARLVKRNIENLNGALKRGLEEVLRTQNKQWAPIIKLGQEHPVNNATGLTYDRLTDYMKLVEKIDDTIEATNDFCAVHTLLILFSCLLHLVVTPYFLLVEICNGGYLPFTFLQLVWIFVHACRLMVIVEICQSGVNEYQKTINLVLKLWTSPLPLNIKEQVEILTVQISNKKIKFSSFGMMKISRSILTAFGGSVTTFLVILFQYGGTKGTVYVRS